MKILITGYFGYKNIGDDAMLVGLREYVKPNDKLVINVLDSGTTTMEAAKYFVEADKVVLCGGTHLRNWGNKHLLQSSRIILLAIASRLSVKGFYMVNTGIDSSHLIKIANLSTTAISNRDIDNFDSSVLIPFIRQSREKVLGVNLSPVNKIYYDNPLADWKIVIKLASSINSWLKINPDWKVRLFSFNGNKKYNDDGICQDAAGLIDRVEYEPYQSDVKKTIEDISRCSAFVGMRFHACLFAYMTGTPVLMINSYPSVLKLATRVGIKPFEQTNNFKQGIADLMNNDKYSKFTMPLIEAQRLARQGIDIIWQN